MNGKKGVFLGMADLIEDFGSQFEERLKERAALSILAGARKFTPINRGSLRKKNLPGEKKDGVITLVNETPYALTQYEDIHNHLIEGGVYMSIENASVDIGEFKEHEMKKMSGSAKFNYGYWMKFGVLMGIGALTPQAARWFHLSAEEFKTVWNEEAQAAFVEELRELERKKKAE